MPRQPPDQIASPSNLRDAANALRSAGNGSGSLADAVSKIASTAAMAFNGTQTALETVEGRLRRLGEPNVPDPHRRTPLLVSGDRIRGGVSVQGALGTVRGQSLDLTFQDNVGTITSQDHQTGNLLPLVLNSAGIVPPAGTPGSLPPGALYLKAVPDLVALSVGVASVAAISSTTWVMAGLGLNEVAANKRVIFIVDGQVGNTANNGETDLNMAYGTGPSPVHGAALPGGGSLHGQPVQFVAAAANDYTPFSKTGLFTGLVPGTSYWFDLAVRVNLGTSILSDVQITGFELPDSMGYVLTVA